MHSDMHNEVSRFNTKGKKNINIYKKENKYFNNAAFTITPPLTFQSSWPLSNFTGES